MLEVFLGYMYSMSVRPDESIHDMDFSFFFSILKHENRMLLVVGIRR